MSVKSFELVIRQLCEIYFIRFLADLPRDLSPYLWASTEKLIEDKVKKAVKEQAASIEQLKEELKIVRLELKEEKVKRRRLAARTGLFSNTFLIINKLL